ncbi:MAG TPA: STAS domain-containing protein [Solirubrobacteraceae bacterium]|nr:STAS domain-containing protein [Solirubrobacteraceae bacterium]
MNQRADLRVQTSRETPELTVVSVAGELDVSTARVLESAVEEACAPQPAELLFDLSELRFMDSAGIAVLLGATRRVPTVRLREPSPAVRRVLEMTGLTTVLPFVDP